MANIWHDKRSTFVDENQFVSAKLQQTHPRVHSVKKKQVFGELKNVIHNQIGVTPLKVGWDAKNTNNKSATKCNEAAMSGVSSKKSCIPIETSNYKPPLIDPVELFDLFDFPKSCCTKNCHKSDVEIWADEYNQIDEIALLKAMEKLRNGSRIHECDEEEKQSVGGVDTEDDFDREEELDDLLAKSVKNYFYLDDRSNDDFTSCCYAEMPKFDILTDLPLLNAN